MKWVHRIRRALFFITFVLSPGGDVNPAGPPLYIEKGFFFFYAVGLYKKKKGGGGEILKKKKNGIICKLF